MNKKTRLIKFYKKKVWKSGKTGGDWTRARLMNAQLNHCAQ